MNIAYFDCFSGAGGDMIVGSLIDAGANADTLRECFDSLGLSGYSLSIERVTKQGFAATRFHVELEKSESDCKAAKPSHRHLSQILEIIEKAPLSLASKEKIGSIFQRLARAEAKVHGSSIEKVHFHEVGAVDAIVDITGAVVGLELLGIERVVCSPITTGSGVVTCEHGVLPVPAPATAELLKGVPVVGGPDEGEQITPTAAAILTTLASEFRSIPPMVIREIGFGAGSREGKSRPNVLRVLVGEESCDAEMDEITVLETNIDDTSPQLVGHCIERLLERGALDAYAVPIQMKKCRSGLLLAVLCEHGAVGLMESILFAETRTFGIRRHRMQRKKLQRRHESVTTRFGEIRVKLGWSAESQTASPEFEDCRAAAQEHNVAVRTVIDAASAAWHMRSRGG